MSKPKHKSAMSPRVSEAKAFLIRQREALQELEQRQFEDSMKLSPAERLMETLRLCDFGAELARASGRPLVTLEDYADFPVRRPRVAKTPDTKQRP